MKPMPKSVLKSFESFKADCRQTIEAINNCTRVRKEKWRTITSDDLSDIHKLVNLIEQRKFMVALNFLLDLNRQTRALVPLDLNDWLNNLVFNG